MASMMDEMAKTLARRRAACEKKDPEPVVVRFCSFLTLLHLFLSGFLSSFTLSIFALFRMMVKTKSSGTKIVEEN